MGHKGKSVWRRSGSSLPEWATKVEMSKGGPLAEAIATWQDGWSAPVPGLLNATLESLAEANAAEEAASKQGKPSAHWWGTTPDGAELCVKTRPQKGRKDIIALYQKTKHIFTVTIDDETTEERAIEIAIAAGKDYASGKVDIPNMSRAEKREWREGLEKGGEHGDLA